MTLLDQPRVRRLAGAAGWILVIAFTVLSLGPPSRRPASGVASRNLEHLAIYLATGLAFAVGYRERLAGMAAGLIAFAGAIELVQLFVPGRHARLSDFIIDALAACAGVALLAAGDRIFQRARSR